MEVAFLRGLTAAILVAGILLREQTNPCVHICRKISYTNNIVIPTFNNNLPAGGYGPGW
jgi:hypothetical protein